MTKRLKKIKTIVDKKKPLSESTYPEEKLKFSEKLTLSISIFSLLISLVAIYFQFFYISVGLKLVRNKFDYTDSTVKVVVNLINYGQKQALVENLKISCGSSQLNLDTTKLKLPLKIESGEIVTLSYTLLLTPEKIYKSSFRIQDSSLVEIPIIIETESLGTKGETYHLQFPSGQLLISKKNATYSYIGYDFLKKPLELIW